MTLLAALAGALAMVGIVMVGMWFLPQPPKRPRSAQSTLRARWARVPRPVKTRLYVGLIVGFVASLVFAFPLLVVIIPAALVGLPMLLGKQDSSERELTVALEAWTRSLAATAETGSFTLREVINVTRGSAPVRLRIPLERMYARMSTTWSTPDALRAFAAELNSAQADETVLYLIQAAEFSAGGLSGALSSVADSLAADAKLKIDTYNEREKPRGVLRTMTILIGVTVAGMVLFAGTSQLSIYKTPFGSIVLIVILGSFVSILLWARSIMRVRPEPRLLETASATNEVEL